MKHLESTGVLSGKNSDDNITVAQEIYVPPPINVQIKEMTSYLFFKGKKEKCV